ncbi:hypothetical protein PHLCEN_2v10852 [Hermanssonia centrifuga]|uniref:Cytochrome P450 n=1 Tax=Hermanssonia centrifuga TaxID=98765 RepID=A0A2R6NLR0_9APHY|nr:hypothetical protein PHLCEN_2v10852 [Hermanssonia centrifuga]
MEAEVQDSCKEMDMLSWLNRTALELIGQSALGYSFDPLVSESRNVFGDALKALLPALSKLSVLRMLVQYFDKLGPRQLRRRLAEMIPNANFQQLKSVIDTMDQKSRDIYSEKKAGLGKDNEAGLQQQLEEDKDILSILYLVSQTSSTPSLAVFHFFRRKKSTLVFAATDTTSSAISRVLHLLAQHQDVQEQLRKEIVEARHGQDISYDQLLELPLLDAVCRETLRLTVQDIVLPLGEPIQDARDGTLLLHEIAVPKHTSIVVGIRGSNRHKAVWGEDAEEWKPVERWLLAATRPSSSDSVSGVVRAPHVPGVYSNL